MFVIGKKGRFTPSGQSELVASTHFPADRRPYQLQNVEAALFAAEEAGCSLDIRGEDIVNGVRSTTLNLLWTLLSNLQVLPVFRICMTGQAFLNKG